MAILFSFILFLFAPETNPVTKDIWVVRPVDIEQDYDQLYMFRTAKRDVEQRLYVKNLGGDKIQFRLIIIRENCDEAYDGEAVTNLEVDPEIDEDETGTAYSSHAFLYSNSKFDLTMRIADDKQRTILQFEPSEKDAVSCLPVSDKIMIAE